MDSDMSGGMVKVMVPASTANLGPGFDVLGVALNLYTEISMEFIKDGLEIFVEGEGVEDIENDQNNLVYKSAEVIFKKIGVFNKGLRIKIKNEIPLGRGLGSSAAAIVGGLLAANELTGRVLKREEILDLAASIEGHADNVTAALNGGLNVSIFDKNKVYYARKALEDDIDFLAFVPQEMVRTEIARKVLPEKVDFNDAVFNTGRTAFLVSVLIEKKYELLKIATQDMLHQKYRAKLVPFMEDCFEKALMAGAYAAFLSGAGPTIMAISSPENSERVLKEVGKIYEEKGLSYRAYRLKCENNGAQVLKAPSFV